MRISDWSSDVCSSDLDALNALLAQAPLIDVVGDSAGGNLTAALSLRLRGRSAIRRQVMIYPFLDLTMASKSIDPPRPGLSRRDAETTVEKYRAEIGRASCRERVWQYV